MIQFFLILSPFAEYAFLLALKMTSAMTLVPYLLVAAYGTKLALTGETYTGAASHGRYLDLVRSAVASLYALGMIYAGGLKFLLLSAALYAPGSILFFMARREQGLPAFTTREWVLFAIVVCAGITGVYALMTGQISV